MLGNRDEDSPIRQGPAILILVRKAGVFTKDLKGSASEESVGANEKERKSPPEKRGRGKGDLLAW